MLSAGRIALGSWNLLDVHSGGGGGGGIVFRGYSCSIARQGRGDTSRRVLKFADLVASIELQNGARTPNAA